MVASGSPSRELILRHQYKLGTRAERHQALWIVRQIQGGKLQQPILWPHPARGNVATAALYVPRCSKAPPWALQSNRRCKLHRPDPSP